MEYLHLLKIICQMLIICNASCTHITQNDYKNCIFVLFSSSNISNTLLTVFMYDA